MEFLKKGTHFDFIGKRYYSYCLSAILVAVSVWIWVQRGDEKYGIDFRGGNEIVVKFDESVAVDTGTLQDQMAKAGFEDAVVQSFELGSHEYILRFRGVSADGQKSVAPSERVQELLKTGYADKFSIQRTDSVGATISSELKEKAIIAVVLGLLAILIYVSIRFEFAFALGAVVALFHDVIVATGGYLLAGHTLNASTIAAALTIVGYSVNDTIVIFDRVREEIMKRSDFDLAELLNEANNLMLSRTIITSLLTFFSAMALLVIGGGAISDLSLYLVVGIVAGSYSTIFIASPIVLAWNNYRRKRLNIAGQSTRVAEAR